MSDPLKFLHFVVETDSAGAPRVLGRGAMGVTYMAFDTNLRVPVALKVISPDLLADPIARDRFLREARTAAALRHQNVATVLFLGEVEGEVFYAMEFVDGKTVQEELAANGPLAPKRALEICGGAVRALTAAHRAGLVHRDIKPSNIMFTQRDGKLHVKLIDFGLAKLATGEFTGQTLAEASACGFQGTPHFASPEQVNGENVDIRSDIYSLGVTLFAMLTGKAPFEGSLAQVLSKHLSMPPPLDSLPESAAAFRPVLATMLAKDPEERFQTPADLRAALEDVSRELLGQKHPGPASAGNGAATKSEGDTPSLPPPPGSVFAGKFKLDERLLVLAHATIHKAARLAEGPPAGLVFANSLDWMDSPLVAEAVNKLRALPTENLIAVVGLEKEAATPALVTEWIEGPTLFDLLKRRRQLSPAEALIILSKVAGGLDALANAGLPMPRLASGDLVIDTQEAMERPLDEIERFRAAFLGIFPGDSASALPGATVVPDPLGDAAPPTAARALAPLAYEVCGGMHLEGGFRWTPLPSLSAYGNSSLKAVLEGSSSLSSATELLDTFRPGAKPPKQTRKPRTSSPTQAPPPEPRFSHLPHLPPPRRSKSPTLLIGTAMVAILLLAGAAFLAWFLGKQPSEPGPTDTAVADPLPRQTPSAAPTPAPTPDPAEALLQKAEDLKRQDDVAGAMALYAQAYDTSSEPETARAQMEMLAAFLRSGASKLDQKSFQDLRPALEQAAQRDVVSAQMVLAETLRPTEPSEALRWFTAAATNGQTEAMTQSGLMLASGLGNEAPDFYAAVGWFKQGVAGGDTDAMVALADCLLSGKGTPPDAVQALELLRTAAVFNHPAGIVMLGNLMRRGVPGVVAPDMEEAYRLFSQATEMGSLEGQANLGVMLVNGWGTEKNPQRALDLWKEGAEGNDPVSMYFYAVALEGGLLRDPRPDDAKTWYLKAAQKGNAPAQDWCRKHGLDWN